jgi:hypothetical protein
MLHPTDSRVVVSIDIDFKNNHTFASGLIIRHERQWNNLNKRETQPVNAIVVSSDHIPAGAEILIHHNASHPVCQILNHKPLSGEEVADTVKYFSIPENQCYLWRLKGSTMWSPMNGFATALRIFQPVETKFYGIAPTLIKNTLYITSGELRGKVVHTLKASDYEVIFRNEKGVEERVIRCRHFKDEHNEREEVIAVDNNLTEMVKNGEIYVGISVTDAKPLNQYYDSTRTSQIIT